MYDGVLPQGMCGGPYSSPTTSRVTIVFYNSRLLWLVLGFCLLGNGAAAAPPDAPRKYSNAALIRFEGVIGPELELYVTRKLEVAKKDGADLVILEIDSLGGRLEESWNLVETMQAIKWAHTVAYVPREAISGAAMVALGCDDIVMAPDARIGDAGPIFLGPDALFRHAPEKIVSDLAVRMRSLAESKGRPPALAEAMVDKKLKVHHVRNLKTGKETYISDRELKADPGDWKDLGTVAASGDGRFLDLTGKQAVEFGLAQGLASNRQELAKRYGVEELNVIQPTGVDKAVDIINSPWITGLLLVIGLVGLYLEFTAPGTALGGLLAGGCFAILFWSHFLSGTAGWGVAALFLVGVALLAVELFLTPGTMVAGLAGAVLILISLVMLIQGFVIPETPRQLQTLSNTLVMIFVSCAAFGVAAVVISRRMGSLPVFNRLTLPPPQPDVVDAPTEGRVNPFAPPPVAIGDLGVAISPLRPGGKGSFRRLACRCSDRRRLHRPRPPNSRRANRREPGLCGRGRRGLIVVMLIRLHLTVRQPGCEREV